jgi:uncharacterized protein YecE (DUF72 family)
VKVGTCGWGYLRPRDFGIEDWRTKFKTKLQCYVSLFKLVEVNSTFYKIPKFSTAERWRDEADEIDKEFEFTVKASQIITHKDKFRSKESIAAFDAMKGICKALRAKLLLLQTPASFKADQENIKSLKRFFKKVKLNGLRIVFEVRGKSWSDEIVKELFQELDLVHCVDIFAREPLTFSGNKILYLRLHGSPPGDRMYYYEYNQKDLNWLKEKVRRIKAREKYVLFNNIWMYSSAREFLKLV